MTYNENGEGVINGKTIREFEAENMKKLAENQQYNMFDSMLKKKLKKQFRKNRHRYRGNKFQVGRIQFVKDIIPSKYTKEMCLNKKWITIDDVNCDDNITILIAKAFEKFIEEA